MGRLFPSSVDLSRLKVAGFHLDLYTCRHNRCHHHGPGYRTRGQRAALPAAKVDDRHQTDGGGPEGLTHWVAEDRVFGWPHFTATHRGGFMGLPGSPVRLEFRVVDIYRRQGSLLAENWVFTDRLHVVMQQGLDVLARNAQV
jgi:hypothetical protein